MRSALALIEQALLGQHHLVNEAANLLMHPLAQALENLALRGVKALLQRPANQLDALLSLRGAIEVKQRKRWGF